MLTIGRWGLRVPQGTDGPPDVPLWMNRLATDLADVAKDNQGTLAARPTSTTLSPGVAGRYYRSSDDGAIARDHGTGWQRLAPAGLAGTFAARPGPSAELEGVSYYATDRLTEYLCSGGTWLITGSQAHCLLSKSATQSIPSSVTPTALTWDVELADPQGMHAANAAGIVPVIDGVWLVNALAAVDNAGATGMRAWLSFYVNGTESWRQEFPVPASAGYPTYNPTALLRLTAGQTVEARIVQTSGGARNVLTGTGFAAFGMKWEAPLA